jgi:hypothetical protein
VVRQRRPHISALRVQAPHRDAHRDAMTLQVVVVVVQLDWTGVAARVGFTNFTHLFDPVALHAAAHRTQSSERERRATTRTVTQSL